jgi:hypothetical protein
VNWTAIVLLILAFTSFCAMVFVIAYVMAVPQAKFECPLSSSQNCSTEIPCLECVPVNTNANKIAEVLQKPKCSSNVEILDFDDNSEPIPRQFSCESSLENFLLGRLVWRGVRRPRISAEYWCTSCTQRSAADAFPIYISIAIFPLSVVYMACSVSVWRRYASWSDHSFLPLEQKLETLLKILQTGNTFLKYVFQAVLFFVLVGFDGSTPGLTCISSGRTNPSTVLEQCNPRYFRRNQIFVLACCCVSFFGVLIVDVAIISRKKFMSNKTEIASGILLCCFLISVISAVQLLQISNIETTFICSWVRSNVIFYSFVCDRKTRENQIGITCDCSFALPTAARAAAATLILDVLSVGFKAVSYAREGKQEQAAVPEEGMIPLKSL